MINVELSVQGVYLILSFSQSPLFQQQALHTVALHQLSKQALITHTCVLASVLPLDFRSWVKWLQIEGFALELFGPFALWLAFILDFVCVSVRD